jgi:hypothetical protein
MTKITLNFNKSTVLNNIEVNAQHTKTIRNKETENREVDKETERERERERKTGV